MLRRGRRARKLSLRQAISGRVLSKGVSLQYKEAASAGASGSQGKNLMTGDTISSLIVFAVVSLLVVVGVGLVKTVRRERRMRLQAALRFKGEWRKIGGIPRINFSSQGLDAQVYVESSGTRPYVLRATHLEVKTSPPPVSFILASRDLPFAEEPPEGLQRAEIGEERIDGRFALLSDNPDAIKPLLLGKLRPILAALDGIAQGNALVVSCYQGKFRITIGRDLVLEEGLDLFVENGIALFRELRKAISS